MADHGKGLRNALLAVFPGITVADCYFHVSRRVKNDNTLGDSFDQVRRDCFVLSRISDVKVFRKMRGAAMKSWEKIGVSPKFLSKWKTTYASTDWCLGALPPGFSSTNNPIEGLNAVIKSVWTRRNKLPLIQFLNVVKNEMLRDWSMDYTSFAKGIFPNPSQMSIIEKGMKSAVRIGPSFVIRLNGGEEEDFRRRGNHGLQTNYQPCSIG
jgi:transposase-like protein